MINADQSNKILTDQKLISTDRCKSAQNPRKSSQGLLYADLTYRIRGAIFAIYNTLGFGHKEQVYQKALEKEFTEINLPFKGEVGLNVSYKNEIVGNYRPDFVIDDKVIIELKAVEFMPKTFETQLLHYLKTTGYQLGLLVNFGVPRLVIKRLIWTGNSPLSVNIRSASAEIKNLN